MFNFNTLAMPTFDQLRATFLLDRINGSNSLISYAWAEKRQSFLSDAELQSYYRAIVFMFRRLGEKLNNGKNFDLKVKASTDYVVSRAVDCNGEKILILLNISPDTPADVSFRINSKSAEYFFDSAWKYHGKDGVFLFRLAPLESKVLKFK